MEDKKIVKLKAIQPDKIVQIDIGSGFYGRVQELLFAHIATVEPEVSIKALNELKVREPADKFEYHLLTLLTLVYNIEQQFHDKGLTQEIDVPVPES